MKLEYKITGSGENIIVFENGLGNSMYGWEFVQNELMDKCRMITYHRAGYGKSDGYVKERTSSNIAEELKNMLEEIGVHEKVILVGHSFGGLCAQNFTRKYRDKVKGIVLIDSTSVNFHRMTDHRIPFFNENMSNKVFVKQWRDVSMKSDEEFRKVCNVSLSEKEKELSDKGQNGISSFMSKNMFATAADEMANFSKSAAEINQCEKMPNIPMVVLARDVVHSTEAYKKYDIPEDEAKIFEELWRSLQLEMSELSENSIFVSAKGCDHSIHMDNPRYVIEAIESVLEKIS